ncbi:MAG: FmdB family transcriptional regulator [Chloroflexi bacterium]|nr:FmdB family transcriptional regulator [Chloroflexota bacterium]
MPIYTYECEECGVRFDARQKFTDEPIAECPECSGHTHRVPQAVGIVFKGSGWYVTDSKGRNNLATPPKKDSDAGEKSESKSSDKAGSAAPAAKKDTSSDAK